MKCPNDIHPGLRPEIPPAGIGCLLGPCSRCGMYYDPETNTLVLPRDKYLYNPGHEEIMIDIDEDDPYAHYAGTI